MPEKLGVEPLGLAHKTFPLPSSDLDSVVQIVADSPNSELGFQYVDAPALHGQIHLKVNQRSG